MSKKIKDHLKQLNMIYLALIAGQMMMCGIFLLLKSQQGGEATNMYIYFGPIISIATLTGAFAIHKTHKNQAKQLNDEEEKLGHHRSSNIVRWALLEGGNLINAVFFFIEGNYIYLMFFSLGMIGFLMFRPTEKVLKEEYGLAS